MSDLPSRIIEKLKQSEYWADKTKITENCIENLTCPECGEARAWAYKKEPWSINCNRLNECGSRTKTLDLFPDIIQRIEKENPPTEADPHRPATAYLQLRGLDEALKGLKYEYWENIRNTGSGGVMFPVGDSWNGRLFNPPKGEGKTHNKGSTSGLVWKHSGREYKSFEETYATEGIITALSLIELGKQAIAVLSAGQDPAKIELSEFKNLVLAFDNDPAGREALIRWKKVLPDTKAMMPINHKDWNDLLLSNSREKVQEYFIKDRVKFEDTAKLAMAKSAEEYVEIYCEIHGSSPYLFTFDKCYYYSYKKPGKDDQNNNDPCITYMVSNFTLETDHYQLDTTVQEEPVNKFYIKIKPKNGRPVSCSVSANELSSPNSLTTMFLQRGRVVWWGDRRPSIDLIKLIVGSNAPVVRQIKIMGHDIESDCYIFKHFMVSNKGHIIPISDSGFFTLSRSVYIRPAPYLTIKPIKGISPQSIYHLFQKAWPEKSIVGLSWMTASWFVDRIKDKIGFFPFLSFYGDPSTGKTFCARRLNACQCLDEEGLPMRKVNTAKGEIRKLAQRSGLFAALLENNNEDSVRFEMDTILTLYNANPLQIRAKKTNDVQTEELPFLSSLLFIQNIEPFKTRAQKERVISVCFKKEDHNEDTESAFKKLINLPIAELAYFFQFVMGYRDKFEDNWFTEFLKAQDDLKTAIEDARLNENHAIVLAFHRILCNILSITHDLQPYIEEIGKRQQERCASRNETTADFFFSILDKFNLEECSSFLSTDEKSNLCVHLPEALQKIYDDKIAFSVALKDLHKDLAEHPAHIAHNKLCRFNIHNGQTVSTERKKAWVFDKDKIHGA